MTDVRNKRCSKIFKLRRNDVYRAAMRVRSGTSILRYGLKTSISVYVKNT